MFGLYAYALNLFTNRVRFRKWISLINPNGSEMFVRNMKMKDCFIRCIGVCRSYVVIYPGEYINDNDFLKKPQYCILAINEQNLGQFLGSEEAREVLEIYKSM